MKKLIVMVAAAALCGVALADTSGYAYFSNYAPVDPSPSNDNNGYYSCYVIASDTVSSAADLETWLLNNGGITRENIAAKSTMEGCTSFVWDNTKSQYTWQMNNVNPLTGDEANKYAVILAATENTSEAPDFAYEIMQGVEDFVTWNFDDTNEGAVTWTSAPVPEPTSGILLLLGVAGLALKRKRA